MEKRYGIEDIKEIFSDYITKIYNMGISNGGEHNSPSPETLKLINGLDQKIESNHKEVKESLSEIQSNINQMKIDNEPIIETYKTVSTVKKWIYGTLITLSVILGIIISFKDIFTKK